MYRALIVCNSRYPDDPTSLAELHGPKVDGILLRDALTDHSAGLFDRTDIRILSDADSREVLLEVEDFFGAAAADDTVLFYYSGHGRSSSQQLFLCARDTVARKLYSTAIPETTLNGVISSSYAQSKILILDCCYSGMFKGDEFVTGLAGVGRYVIAATSSTNRAHDGNGPGIPSPFTRILTQGLASEASDRDHDGQVDLDDLFSYLSSVEFEGPRPQRKYDGAGAVPIARRPLAIVAAVSKANETVVPAETFSPTQQGQRGAFLDTLTSVTVYSPERVRDFRKGLRKDVADTMPDPLTAAEFLQRANLLQHGKLTYAGVLLFGENPTAVLPSALVQCVQIHGTSKEDPLENVELRGTLPELVLQARDFVANLVRRGETPTAEGAYAEPVYAYPMIAVREIIANAVVHRDYEATESCVQIHVYSDRIEVINPGNWGNLTSAVDGRSRLGRLERQSHRRNFRLAQVLTWSKLVEGVGSGVPRSVADCKRLGAPEPIVATADGLVAVTIYPKPPDAPRESVSSDVAIPSPFTPDRISEVIADGEGGSRRRGSGYRVTQEIVLTAAHIVAEASRIALRFDADRPTEWNAAATIAWIDQKLDVAALRLDAPSAAPSVRPVRYAELADSGATVDVVIAGFPRWKMRSSPDGRAYRDLAHVAGTAALLSNRRERTLEVAVNAPAADPDPAMSPWEGMSGAAVWAGEYIVGVVTSHNPREGIGRLTVARIDRSLESAGSEQLAELLGVPLDVGLTNVVPAGQPWSDRSGYLALVKDIAPAGGLIDREVELAELASFCTGSEPYVWWQGAPWTGKTALMSTFVLNPPVGVDIVSFFVTARLAAQADSSAFTDALLDQLSAMAGMPLPSNASLSTRDVQRRTLLTAATRRARQTGRRLVLVVDGLDEDQGGAPGSRVASIASLLPKVPVEGMRVIVAGRPDPPIPTDVPADHPLRACPIRRLLVSPHAIQVQRLARNELNEIMARDDQATRDVIGLILASDGPLTLNDLCVLTGLPRYELERMLDGYLGRSLVRRENAPAVGESVFTFAHEELTREASERLGPTILARYRERIHAWADSDRGR